MMIMLHRKISLKKPFFSSINTTSQVRQNKNNLSRISGTENNSLGKLKQTARKKIKKKKKDESFWRFLKKVSVKVSQKVLQM